MTRRISEYHEVIYQHYPSLVVVAMPGQARADAAEQHAGGHDRDREADQAKTQELKIRHERSPYLSAGVAEVPRPRRPSRRACTIVNSASPAKKASRAGNAPCRSPDVRDLVQRGGPATSSIRGRYVVETPARNGNVVVSRHDRLSPVAKGRSRSVARSRATRSIDYATLADLRYSIRRFLRRREVAARAAGVEPQQYLALLQIKGLERRGAATIGMLAERLQIHHHAAVQLVDRLTRQALVDRRREGKDRRQVVVVLRPAGEAILRRLALYSLAELKTEGPALVASLRQLVKKSAHRGRASTRDR
jgi:DNA-binding MarR family transcriptional regulator